MKGGIFAAIILAAVASAAQERPARPPQTDETVAVAKGARLAISNFAGDVIVRTWDKDALRVQGRHSSRAKINIRNTPAGVSVSASSTSGPAGAVDYEITTPAWMPVKVEGQFNFVTIDGAQSEVSVETVRGDVVIKGGTGFVSAKSVEGEVAVEGARGRINVSSVNQGITITGASGEITAETVNGSIKLSRIDSSSVDIGTINGDVTYEGNAARAGRYRFTTHNGNIIVSVPETADATFSVRTYNGSFNSNLPVQGAGDVKRGRRVTYTLGNGSAEFELESFGGNIRLRKPGTIADSRSKEAREPE